MLKQRYDCDFCNTDFGGVFGVFLSGGDPSEKRGGKIAEIRSTDEEIVANCADGYEGKKAIPGGESAAHDFEI